MNPLMLIKGELRRSFGGILALALVLALSLSLGVGVSMTERAVRQGTARAGDAFDLLVGAQGSSVQLMLGAVYLRPQSLPLVPGGAVTEILTQEGVVWAAPLAFGDRWNASPLVGTTTDMVTLGGNGRSRKAGIRRTGRSRTRCGCPPAARRGVFPHARAGLRIPQRTRTFPLQGRRPPAGNGHAVGQRHPHSHRIGLGRPRCASRCGAWPAPRASF
ncbi:hypothetical protein [Bilophila wadsworthia]|uniref:hypothetical protein n=1 Tax=Bilophila wadsworthia TaxID=35833 RepID=UPI003990AB92